MDIEQLLADPAYDFPMPPGTLGRIDRRARRLRRRRAALTVLPILVVCGAVTTLLSAQPGTGFRHAPYGASASPTSSPSPQPPSLPYQRANHAMVLNCAIGVTEQEMQRFGGFASITNFVTGDPVEDCAALMVIQGVGTPPTLTAYADGHVYLTVVPSSWTMPASYKPLAAGFHVDLARVAAEHALDDPIDGPAPSSTQCLSQRDAVDLTRTRLNEVGLPSYTIDVLEPARGADGSTTCAFAIFPPEDGTKVLIQGGDNLPPTGSGPTYRFINLLRRDVAGRCLSAVAAEAKVKDDARSAGLSTRQYTIVNRADRGGDCTRVDLADGGRATVVLRSAPLP